MIEVVELTRYWVAAVEPKLIPLTPLNPAPVTVTEVPPPGTPDAGLTAVTLGAPINQVSLMGVLLLGLPPKKTIWLVAGS